MNSEGQVVTANGFLLEPSITIPEATSTLTISRDGIVNALIDGDTAPTQIGQLDIVDFVNPAGLQSLGGNLFRQTGSSGEPITGTPSIDGLGSIEQGALEGSNVEVVEELVNMISVQRAYEMNSKVVSTADQMLQFLTQNT
jgi:flagellar basal-body rod protein FlgG